MNNNYIFSHFEPTADWTNPHRTRCFIASLVEGVYRLEHDRLGNRHRCHGPDQADLVPPPWRWRDFFHEPQADHVLRDPNGTIFGAIYEYKYPPSRPIPNPNVPRYVIAFRGIIRKLPTIKTDILSVVQDMLNEPKWISRFHCAMEVVQSMVDIVGPANVWLAGHSLGSALALRVGKKMVMEKGVHLETYLFNPPFRGLPIEMIKSERFKRVVRTLVAIGKAGLDCAVGGHHQHLESFAKLSRWFPRLLVNQGDPFCSEYIGYFENREFMKQIGAENIETIAGTFSLMSLVFSGDSEAFHLIPSAYLTINKVSRQFKQDHAIDQWWDPNFTCEPMLHLYQNHLHPMVQYELNKFTDTPCMPYQNHLHPTVQYWLNNFTDPPGMPYHNRLHPTVQHWPNNFTDPPSMPYQNRLHPTVQYWPNNFTNPPGMPYRY